MDTAIIEHPKIAIVDDNRQVRDTICELLNLKGYQTSITAANGQLFIDAIRNADQLPDICLIDLEMPVMNGYDTIKAIRQEWPDLKIIACSVNAAAYQIAQVIKLGANVFWQKGGTPRILIEHIEEILADRINST